MRRITRLAAGLALSGALALGAPTAAGAAQTGGAVGLIAAVVQVDRSLNDLDVLSNIGEINIVYVEDSLNNLQVLNNSPILSNNVVTVQDVLQDCAVAGCIEIRNVLNNLTINIDDVLAIDVLSGGDINVYVAQ